MWLLLSLLGCGDFAPTVDMLETAQMRFPSTTAPEWVLTGGTLDVTITRVGDSGVVMLWASTSAGQTCPPEMRGTCIDLGAPAYLLTQQRALGAPVRVTRPVPPVPPGTTLHLQAVAAEGTFRMKAPVFMIDVYDRNGDEDADGLTNAEEEAFGSSIFLADADRDRLTDLEERAIGTNPTRADSDGDGLSDRDEHLSRGTDPVNPDTDNDGRWDGAEVNGIPRTDPFNPDTDGDGFLDGAELADGTDPTNPADPWGDVDDTGIDPADRCPAGEVPNCWGACVADTRGDQTCDRAFDCPRYDHDRDDCVTRPPPAAACPPGEEIACWGGCEPVASRGDATCDAVWACPAKGWDGGDCPDGAGTTLVGSVTIDSPTAIAALAGVHHLRGTLTIAEGAPASVVLPELRSAERLIVQSSTLSHLDLPALAAVTQEVSVDAPALTGVYLPALRGAERIELFTAPATVDLRALTAVRTVLDLSTREAPRLDALMSVGTLWARGNSNPLIAPALARVENDLIVAGLTRVDLPSLRDGHDLTLFNTPLIVAPNWHQIDRLYTYRLTSARIEGPQALDLWMQDGFTEGAVLDTPDLQRARRVIVNATFRAPSWTWLGGHTVDELLAHSAAGEVHWPDIEVIGRMHIVGSSSATFDLPSVTTISQLYWSQRGTSTLRLPSLTTAPQVQLHLGAGSRAEFDSLVTPLDGAAVTASTAGWRIHTTEPGQVYAPNLEQLGRIYIAGPGAFDAPRWTDADVLGLLCVERSSVRAPWSQSGLRTIGRLHTARMWYRTDRMDWWKGNAGIGNFVDDRSNCLREIVAPNLESVGEIAVAAPNLRRLELPALRSVDRMEVVIVNLLSLLDLQSLTTAEEILFDRVRGPYALDLPALTEVDTLHVTEATEIAGLHLPALTSARSLRISEADDVSWGDVTTDDLTTPPPPGFDLDLPALTEVHDLFVLHDRRVTSVSLPSLTHVSGFLRAHDAPNLTSIDAPLLATTTPTAQINLVNTPGATTLNLPSLTDGGRIALGGTAIDTLDLPALLTLGDDLSAWDNAGLTAIEAPHLLTVADLYLDGNQALASLDLPSLIDADTLTVLDHPALDACPLFDQVPAAPVTTDQTCAP